MLKHLCLNATRHKLGHGPALRIVQEHLPTYTRRQEEERKEALECLKERENALAGKRGQEDTVAWLTERQRELQELRGADHTEAEVQVPAEQKNPSDTDAGDERPVLDERMEEGDDELGAENGMDEATTAEIMNKCCQLMEAYVVQQGSEIMNNDGLDEKTARVLHSLCFEVSRKKPKQRQEEEGG